MNESKEHILLIASALFLQKSFKEVTMKEIVDKTGLSKGAFYHYFVSKEQLFHEVVAYFFQEMWHQYESYSRESFRQFYLDYIMDTIVLGKNYVNKFSGEFSEQGITLNYFTLMFDALKLLPEFRESAIAGFNEELDHWTQAVARGREKGEINSSMSDREIGELFLYLSDGIGMHMVMRGKDVENMVGPIRSQWDKLYELIKS